ncbi:MAG TPA: MerR family transcriptional regulator [Anaerolineales bacterium]|nr:MerR family transcriptional regulator [Anaerolineales bacterium]HNE66848.1 MerR family transcriptional regulator [Anaerolineales bacterium]
MSISKNPAFNLKVVLQETGIAADTLRAWERRYGIPMPQRTAGGHRLYSQYDIETIKWLMARQAEGLSISRAVDLWNEHNASGVDPLAGFIPTTNIAPLATPAITLSADTSLDSMRAQWIDACLNFSEATAEQVLNQGFSMFPVEVICTEVLQRGMSEIGGLWYENRASVQQEHFASGLAMRRLDALISASPAPSLKQTVLVGCPPNEWHTFTPLLLCLLLRRRGFGVIYLGANVPAEQFEETVSSVHANMVVLVAQTLITAAALHSTALSLVNMKIPVGFGGRIFNIHPALKEYIPGHYLGNTVTASVERIEQLLKGNQSKVQAKSATEAHHVALEHFNSQRLHIESSIKEMLPPFVAKDIDTGIHFLGDNIAAALQLGDMEHVTAELEWLKVLMQSHQRPASELADFMHNYATAVDKHINGRGEPIKVWLNEQARLTQL